MTLDDGVALLGQVVENEPEIGHEEMESMLTAMGFGEEQAERLVAFVPIALGRVWMSGMGPRFSDDCIVARHGVRQQRPLAEVPEFVAGMAAAHRLSVDQIWQLARRGSELVGVNTMLHRGSDPADLMLAPVVVLLVAGRP